MATSIRSRLRDSAVALRARTASSLVYLRNGFNMSRYGNADATLDFIAAADDEECGVRETEGAIDQLQDAGYDASFTLLNDANHFTPIFHDNIDGEWVLVPDEPAGEQTVQVILDAIADGDA